MRVLFFAHLKEATGCAELELDAVDLDSAALWSVLTSKYPGLERFRASVRLARNGEYVGASARFGGADEVALIPPVSGG